MRWWIAGRVRATSHLVAGIEVGCCQCQVRVADQAEQANAGYGLPEEQADAAGGGRAEGQALVGL